MVNDRFYEHEPSDMIVCGECALDSITRTLNGEYTGDEAVKSTEYRLLLDDDTEPYQCDDCGKQNEAYDEQ